MLKAFVRGQLPRECLIRIDERVLRVDKTELERWFLERGIRGLHRQ